MYEINEQQIRLWWQVFNPQNKLVEIRLLGKNTYSGYFKDIETLLYNIKPLLDYNNEHFYGSLQAYFTLNEINDDLYSREQKDKFVKKPKSTTNDSDIVRRRMVLIDFDPCRSAGISASEEEFEKAHLKAIEVYRYLIEQGFNQPIVTKSGNGWHLYLPCDMPNDEEHNQTIKRFLQSLAKMFGDKDIELDEKVFNPARIDKLVGTWAKKGSDSEERRWRIAEIVKIPNDLSPNKDELFEKIANLLPKEEPKVLPNRRQNYNASFDLVSWLNTYGIKYREKTIGSSICYELYECPFIDQHSDRKNWDSALFVDREGKITFHCHHNHCKDKTWHDVRLHYEPDAYDKPQYQPIQTQQRIYKSAQIKPQYEVKKEDNELGSKWKSLSSIKKIDLSSLEKARTGFTELDKAIGGLHFSEITILSGSNSSGKSSWLNTLMFNIVEQDYKVALWSGELNDSLLKAWIQMVGAGKTFLKPSQFGDGKYYVPNNIGELIDEWLEGKFFLYNNEYGSKWEQLLNDMNEIYEQGVRVFILDNLMALDIDLFDGDKNNKQKELILQLKDFAKKKNVHIILVAHPRKTLTFLRKQDVSGSADLTNLADNVFIMHRNNNDFQKALDEHYGKGANVEFMDFGNVLSVEKNRMYGVEKMVGMYFEKESRRFLNTSNEDVKYGWVDLLHKKYYEKPQINQQNEEHIQVVQPNDTLDNVTSFGTLENGNPFEEEKYIFD